jgi:hypothetical protein
MPGQPHGHPHGQPPGQPPGQWQPGGYGQYPPPPPTPPAPPARKKRAGLIVLLVLLLIGGGLAGFFLLRKDDTPAASEDKSAPGPAGESAPASPDPGICIEFTSETLTNAEIAEVSCDAPEAAYKVAKRLDNADDSCPSDDYDAYQETGIGNGYKLCLMLNGTEGACLDNVDSTSLPTERADCATARFKVIKAVDGEAAESACPTGETIVPVTYPEPPTTVCVEAI